MKDSSKVEKMVVYLVASMVVEKDAIMAGPLVA